MADDERADREQLVAIDVMSDGEIRIASSLPPEEVASWLRTIADDLVE